MKISEVSAKYNLTAHTLRYYEKIGLLLPVKKNESGIREYGEDDLARLEFINCMKSAGVSLAILKEYIDLVDEGEHTCQQRQDILQLEKEKLLVRKQEIEDSIDFVDYKIDLYEKIIKGEN